MSDNLLLGIGRHMFPVPGTVWHRQAAGNAHEHEHALAFMSPDHHRVRNFVVSELPRAGRPLAPSAIAAALELPQARLDAILAELERRLTFLFRDAQGAVEWAYPVTAAHTRHYATFSTGEQIYAA